MALLREYETTADDDDDDEDEDADASGDAAASGTEKLMDALSASDIARGINVCRVATRLRM